MDAGWLLDPFDGDDKDGVGNEALVILPQNRITRVKNRFFIKNGRLGMQKYKQKFEY